MLHQATILADKVNVKKPIIKLYISRASLTLMGS